MHKESVISHQASPKKSLSSFLRPACLLFDKTWVNQHILLLLFSLIALGILINITMFFYAPSNPPFKTDGNDWSIAANLVNGQGYAFCQDKYFPFCGPGNQVTAMREPVGVLLMAAAMLISPSQVSGLIMLKLLYLGTLVMIYIILKDTDRRLALLGAFLWLISIPVIQGLNEDGGDLAGAFFFSIGLYFFQKGRREHKVWHWILSGIFLGLASLSRSIFLGIAIGLGVGLLIERPKGKFYGWRARLGPVLILISSLGLVVTPWIVRNNMVFGTPVVGSSLTGYNIFRMNYIIADNHFIPRYVGSKEAYSAVTTLVEHSNLSGTENEAQMQAFYTKAGLEIIRQYPVRYLYLSLYRFFPLWFNVDVEEAYGGRFYWDDYVALVQQFILLLGILFSISRNLKDKWPFLLSLVLGCGAYMAIDAQLRYLVDIMPAIIVLVVLGLPDLRSRILRTSILTRLISS